MHQDNTQHTRITLEFTGASTGTTPLPLNRPRLLEFTGFSTGTHCDSQAFTGINGTHSHSLGLTGIYHTYMLLTWERVLPDAAVGSIREFLPWVHPLGSSLGFIPWVHPLGSSLGFIHGDSPARTQLTQTLTFG